MKRHKPRSAFAAVRRRVAQASLAATIAAASCAAHALVVAVDVGHSLARPGSTSASGRPEFEYNRALAHDVIAQLAALGIRRLLGSMDRWIR